MFLVIVGGAVVDFVEFRPSVIAAAAVVTGAGDGLVTGDVCSICHGLDEVASCKCRFCACMFSLLLISANLALMEV